MARFVVPHDPTWKAAYQTEARAIATALHPHPIELHHIGSTAIPDILAKPTIDLMGVVLDLPELDAQSNRLAALGYEVMGAFGISGRRYFRKMTDQGQRTHHLHIYGAGSAHIERHIAFRDYLLAHPTVAADYSALKASLTDGQTSSWDDYMDGKDPFIKATEQDALRWFREMRP